MDHRFFAGVSRDPFAKRFGPSVNRLFHIAIETNSQQMLFRFFQPVMPFLSAYFPARTVSVATL
jgi:hypothetical protein